VPRTAIARSLRSAHRYISPVLRFLSADWLRAFDDALRADRDLGVRFSAHPIAIAQEVEAGGELEAAVRYVVVLDASGGRVEVSPTTAADVTFLCDRATAADLARGALNAQRALTTGRLKVRGEVDRLGASSAALAGLGDLLGALREDTEF
jgi:SCP-2 sterol transfer family